MLCGGVEEGDPDAVLDTADMDTFDVCDVPPTIGKWNGMGAAEAGRVHHPGWTWWRGGRDGPVHCSSGEQV